MEKPDTLHTVSLAISGDLRLIKVAPDDLVVVETDALLTNWYRGALYQGVKALFPCNRVVVLDGGLRLALVRQG
jgi:hypothetical protein